MIKPNRIVIFDFDCTLVNTVCDDVGRDIWKEKTGYEFPHIGWWAQPDSLSTEVFEHPLNMPVYREYQKWSAKDDTLVYLVTGRIEKKMKESVEKILDMHNLTFDGVQCNNTPKNTFSFKSALFEKMIEENPTVNEFVIYEDRSEHIYLFKNWMDKLDTKVILHDVINLETHRNH